MSDKQNTDADKKSFLLSFYEEALDVNSNNLFSKLIGIKERYSEGDHFASGGIKDISACVDKATNRLVAKAVLKEIKNDSDVEQFLREAHITASLQHPNILPVYDIGIDEEDRPFFTMKLVEGKSLQELLDDIKKGSEVPLESLIDMFIRITEAIGYAHSKGVIHLDIKPDNVQISDYGEVLVCDWGLAKILDDKWENEAFEGYSLSERQNINKTMDGYIKGTPGYLSPEQVIPGSRRDERSDIYSLGAVLYEILTGEKPVQGENVEEILKNTLDGKIKDPSELKYSIPKSLAAISMKALKTNPDERYQSAIELLDDLLAYTRGYATSAEEAGLMDVFKLFLKRNAAAAVLSLVFAIFSAAALVIFISNIQEKKAEAQHQRDRAFEALKIAEREKEKSDLYSKKFTLDTLTEAEIAFGKGDYAGAEKYLSFIGKEGYELLFKIRVLQERFNDASLILNKIKGDKHEKLKEALDFFVNSQSKHSKDSKTVLALFTDRNQVLSEEILKISNLETRQLVLEKVVKKMPLWERKKIVERFIIEVDKLDRNFEINLEGNEDELKVKIRDPGFKSVEFLKYLGGIKHLDISRTQVSSLEAIDVMPIENLNISWTKISDPRLLFKMENLKLLNAHYGQFPLPLIKKLNIPIMLETER